MVFFIAYVKVSFYYKNVKAYIKPTQGGENEKKKDSLFVSFSSLTFVRL